MSGDACLGEKVSYGFIGGFETREVGNRFGIIDVIEVGKLFAEDFFIHLGAKKCLCLREELRKGVAIFQDEVEIDIVFPLGAASESEEFHGAERYEIRQWESVLERIRMLEWKGVSEEGETDVLCEHGIFVGIVDEDALNRSE